jgi:hypothetical protein
MDLLRKTLGVEFCAVAQLPQYWTASRFGAQSVFKNARILEHPSDENLLFRRANRERYSPK